MIEKEPQVTQPPQAREHQRSLKQKIHDNEERLAIADGPEQAARLLETLFGDLRSWIVSEGTPEEIERMYPIKEDFSSTQIEKVTDEASTVDFKETMIYTIENDESTESEVYLSVAQETKSEMVKLTWRRLEEKRINQYQRLKEIFGHKFKSDEIIHDIRETPGTVRDRIRARRDRNEDMD